MEMRSDLRLAVAVLMQRWTFLRNILVCKRGMSTASMARSILIDSLLFAASLSVHDSSIRPLSRQRGPDLEPQGDIFSVLRQRSLLLHHPYESFSPVINLLRQAAADRDVLAIKITLYRTGSDSPLVQALIDAARRGTEVTAVVELRARFDEAANIDLATRLQAVGANVVYGVVGYKAHAKMLMVVRREGRELKRYVHLGYWELSFWDCQSIYRLGVTLL